MPPQWSDAGWLAGGGYALHAAWGFVGLLLLHFSARKYWQTACSNAARRLRAQRAQRHYESQMKVKEIACPSTARWRDWQRQKAIRAKERYVYNRDRSATTQSDNGTRNSLGTAIERRGAFEKAGFEGMQIFIKLAQIQRCCVCGRPVIFMLRAFGDGHRASQGQPRGR